MGSGDHPARRLERRWAPRYSFRADLEIEWGSAVLHRSPRSALGGRGLHRATDSPSPCKTRLFRETDRTRTRHGGVRGRFRVRKPEALPGPAFLALRHRLLIPFYTKSDDSLP